ncbi:MAG: LacI family DNA-binding transcriptional regulator [Suilimivivens sp.]
METKKMTIDDIARDLGISKTTVSRAISGKGRIGQETRERVLRYIDEYNYRPSAIAKGLAQSKTFNIALVMPGDYSNSDLPFFQKCMWGISTMASRMDYDVIISMVEEGDISQLVRMIDHHKVDGAILSRTLENDESAAYLLANNVPFVTVGSSDEDAIVQVDNDHFGACKELTSILLHKGIRKMALIGGNTGFIVNQKRLLGFREAFMQAGIPIDNSLLYLDIENMGRIENIVEEILAKKAECIMCMDDSICSCVLNKLNQDHIRIPEEIKVASFYSSSFLEQHQPAITELKFDVAELGMVCCSTLLDYIDKKDIKRKTLLGYEVLMKESTKN